MAALNNDNIVGTDIPRFPLTSDGLEALVAAPRNEVEAYIEKRFKLVGGQPIPEEALSSLALQAIGSLKKSSGTCCCSSTVIVPRCY